MLLQAIVPAGYAQNKKSGFETQEVLKNTVVTIKAEGYRGNLQWQMSENLSDWVNMAGETGDSVMVEITENVFFRVGVKENTCDWFYSTAIKYIPIELPEVNTYSLLELGMDKVLATGEISSSGNDTLKLAGVCYGFEPDPDTSGLFAEIAPRQGSFEISITGLQPNTQYYARAFAINSAGISYSENLDFVTLVGYPEVTMQPASEVTDTSALLTGTASFPFGGFLVDAGFCFGPDPNPDINGEYVSVQTDSIELVHILTGLLPNTLYYVRAFVTNEAGIAYSSNQSFTTRIGLPKIATLEVFNIESSLANAIGEVIDESGGTVTERGICWGTTLNPDTTHHLADADIGLGQFSILFYPLIPNTVYHLRAYAVNEAGIGFGEDLEFTTIPAIPEVITQPASVVGTTTATVGGEILFNGGSPIITKGVCYSTLPEPTISDKKSTTTVNSDRFTVALTNLLPNTVYYIRAFASNSHETGYGQEEEFQTNIAPPTVKTNPITSITYKSAGVSGSVTYTGNGNILERGICYSRESNPTVDDSVYRIGTGSGDFSGVLAGLTHNVKYYIKAYCINDADTAYGSQLSFTTKSTVPLVNTITAYDITSETCHVDGQILDTGGSAITAKGICWGTSPYPDITGFHTLDGTGTADFTGLLTDLGANKKYYYRAYATSSAGTSYGSTYYFKTPDDGSYKDVPVLSNDLRASFRGWTGIFPDKGTASTMGYSGVSYDWERNQLYIIGNNALYIWVIEAPGYGKWTDNNPGSGYIRAIQLEGFSDTEAVNYLGNSWLMVAEEGERKIYFFEIDETTTKITKGNAAVKVDPTALFSSSEAKLSNTQMEGIAFDFQNQKIYALCETGPLDYPRLFMWDWDPAGQEVLAGSRVEITQRFEGLSTDFPAASDLFYSPLLRRLYIVDGSSNKMGEFDVEDPNKATFGRRLALMLEPLANGLTGADLGDLEGFGISADGLYIYMCFEDKSFGYAIAPLIRNHPDNNLPTDLYPFNGTAGSWTSDDFPELNDPTVYLNRFKGASAEVDTLLRQTSWTNLKGANDSILANLSDIAFDEVNDRICLVTRTDPGYNQQSYLSFFDRDGSYAGRHTLVRSYATESDGSNLPGLTQSKITGVQIKSHTNLTIRWLSGLDGSILEAALDGLAGPQTLGNPLTDGQVTLVGPGQGYGTSTGNTYECMASDMTHRNCVWAIKQTSFRVEEYRNGDIYRSFAFGNYTVPGTSKTVAQLMTNITGLYYDDLSDHLFIGGYNSTTGESYILEMKMLDKTIMGYLKLKRTLGLEGFSLSENLSELAVLYKSPIPVVDIFKK
jgi:uncharacterized protein YjiK